MLKRCLLPFQGFDTSHLVIHRGLSHTTKFVHVVEQYHGVTLSPFLIHVNFSFNFVKIIDGNYSPHTKKKKHICYLAIKFNDKT